MSSSDPKTPEGLDQTKAPTIENGDEDQGKEREGEEEEVGECGFCLFMKGGGCKDAFIAWENCIEEAEKKNEDIVEKCYEVTGALKKCMEAHADYYEPILRAEKAEEEAARKKSDEEKASNKSESNVAEKAVEQAVDSKDSEKGS
ncbi:hypothetical protein P3X46_034770 [Hevea brasiliensis]|uniref:GCK domain-containing protein n=1 Tax=Hevea brasiliensis TaxID=3981 RepID=A0ABQ9KD20_HEVBR|nr:uncharacterized protein LOC110638446 [Hevea brasiliensis]XP_021644695.2 uncharacterized protein LOC110638446 [Hevea brasiliensis]XP_021644696.2 uncharacterized protein LOC110638446 [Hevea brasiliensis]XP_021644697.2 uncharacterized protein LOC110638446 [Hevea brasiliensis]KAJ9131863.1 hypothetical protein P3X46_034770 [Hevea brasiliensis]